MRQLARGAFEWKWTGLLNGDDGAPLSVEKGAVVFSDKTVQVTGTFGVGGNVIIEGSNSNASYKPLNDPQGTPLSTITDETVSTILENPADIKPRVSAGDGTTDLTVIIVGRAIMQLR